MILLPSRGRPKKLERFFDAYKATEATEPGLVMLEERDRKAYEAVEFPNNWNMVIVPESLVSKKFNDGALVYAPNESRYFVMADDVVPETKHWDRILSDDAQDFMVAYGDDCIHPQPPLGHPCIGGKLVAALGWIAHPVFGHFYWDNALRDIVLGVGDEFLSYRPDVVMRHLHFTVTGDRDVFERGLAAEDCIRYEKWKKESMQDDIERVKLRYGFYHRA